MIRKRGFVIFVILVFSGLVFAATFSDVNLSDFNDGTYVNTTHNGTAVILSGDNLTGTYTSGIFDSGALVTFGILSFTGNSLNSISLFVVDGSGAIYSSSNRAITWSEINGSYGGGTGTNYMAGDINDTLYILFGQSVYRSLDKGISWTEATSDFNPSDGNGGFVIASSKNGTLLAVDGSGDVFASGDLATNWSLLSDFDESGSANPKGIAVNSSDAIFIVDGNGGV